MIEARIGGDGVPFFLKSEINNLQSKIRPGVETGGGLTDLKV